MDWKKLLSAQRLGKSQNKKIVRGRSPFQQDFDRISFSSAEAFQASYLFL